MTTALRTNHIQDEFGRPVPGASIYVYNPDGSLAALTSDGTTAALNPLTTDAFGNYSYYALVGYYREDVWFGGIKRWSEDNVAIGSPAGLVIAPQYFGAKADGISDDHAALQAWLDRGGLLALPVAAYYSSDNLTLRRNAVIDGDGYGFDARVVDGSATLAYEKQPGARIHFAAGKGFRVDPQTTVTDVATAVAAGVAGYTQEGGFHSTIRNLAFVGAGTGTAVAGFYSRSEVHLENVYALKFAGKGFDISASAGTPDGNSEFGTADLCTLKNCQSISNGSHGFHVRGSEVNVIGLDTCNAFGNGGWGYLDESALGLNYTNCHAAGNASGSFKCIGSVANSTYTGCYVEGDTGKAPDLSSRCVVSGGYLADFARLYNVGSNGNPTISNGAGVTTFLATLRTAQDEATTATTEGLVYRGANSGLILQGAPNGGGTYDVSLVNKSAGRALSVPTGTTDIDIAGNTTIGSGKVYKVNGTQVLGARQTGCPAAATDLATAITLVNFLRTAGLASGYIGT